MNMSLAIHRALLVTLAVMGAGTAIATDMD